MWATLVMPNRTVTEVHVMPLGDTPLHTAPICWCKPQRKTTQRIWTHNAVAISESQQP